MVQILSADFLTYTLPRVTAATLKGIFLCVFSNRETCWITQQIRCQRALISEHCTVTKKKRRRMEMLLKKKKKSLARSSCIIWRWRRGEGAEKQRWEARVESKCCTRAGRVSSASVCFLVNLRSHMTGHAFGLVLRSRVYKQLRALLCQTSIEYRISIDESIERVV